MSKGIYKNSALGKHLKHYVDDHGIYYLVDEDMNIYLTIELSDQYPDQVVITTETSVYEGPISFLDVGNQQEDLFHGN